MKEQQPMQDRGEHDRIEDHYGQQLSALMDGELSPDQARFLLRRLQHDHELAGAWERWQVAGDAMRGHAGVLLPAGFSERVSAATKREPVPGSKASPSWLRWSGGAALAASVAVVALFVARQAPEVQTPATSSPAVVATQPASAPAAAPVMPAPVMVEAPTPARVLASVDDAPPARTPEARRRAPRTVESTPAALPGAPAAQVAVATVDPSAPAPQNPFLPDAEPAARPWPRAVLPELGNGGTFATRVQASSGFYPFAPRLPEAQPAAPDPQADTTEVDSMDVDGADVESADVNSADVNSTDVDSADPATSGQPF
jgi:negative regulator of sigma E activity